ncbi:hypothetical protein [Synechococcus sp. UW179A]|uniref:hypothetical protein n=1 Tax=Synechococcus sp. UW179A TaxID=2575510 RepID=UPI001FCA7CBD|nr:hypothetical protein [Synechococcus sp. UW179A]
MSDDHWIHNQFDPSERPIVLDAAPGMTVIVKHDRLKGRSTTRIAGWVRSFTAEE